MERRGETIISIWTKEIWERKVEANFSISPAQVRVATVEATVVLNERNQLIKCSTFINAVYFPLCRSLVQIKSHAQKVLKRQEAGDDIFRILQDTSPALIDSLVVQAARERDAFRAAGVSVTNTAKPSKNLMDASKKSVNNSGDNSNDYNTKKSIGKQGRAESGPESVIAAAALCQLSSVVTQQQWDQLDPLDVTMMVNQEANV